MSLKRIVTVPSGAACLVRSGGLAVTSCAIASSSRSSIGTVDGGGAAGRAIGAGGAAGGTCTVGGGGGPTRTPGGGGGIVGIGGAGAAGGNGGAAACDDAARR